MTLTVPLLQPLGSLHLLASEGDTAAVAFLLDNSADVDSRDADGCTALHWAADRGSLEVLLLRLLHHRIIWTVLLPCRHFCAVHKSIDQLAYIPAILQWPTIHWLANEEESGF